MVVLGKSVKEARKENTGDEQIGMLSREQLDVYRSSRGSYALVGSYGSGKTLIIEQEVMRV